MNRTRTAGSWLLIFLLACSPSGCATIVSGRKSEVTVDNSGGPTYFSVLDSSNRVVHSGVTPQQITLKSSSGPFRRARYQVVYAGQDEVRQTELNTSLNWWTAGNIVIGGIPGIVIDAGTGALWKLPPVVDGKVPSQNVVSDATLGAVVLASYSGEGSSNTEDASTATRQEKVRQASFDKSASPEQTNR